MKTVVVSGASVAGTAAAYWLGRHGYSVTMVERHPGLRPGGQAIDVRGPALDVLERMGLLAAAQEHKTRIRGASFVDRDGNELFRDTESTPTGGPVNSPDIELLRDDLVELLYGATQPSVEYLFDDSISTLQDDGDSVRVNPDRLEARTRAIARLGSFFSDRRMAALRAAEVVLSSRIQSIFDDVDVVVTPGAATGPSRIGAYQRRGAVSTLLLVVQRVPYFQVWNLTGQPAAVVPWDFDGDGLPMSVQLVGRPYDEATLLALAAQIESARPWAHRRPSVS